MAENSLLLMDQCIYLQCTDKGLQHKPMVNPVLTLSVPRGVLRSHGSIRHPWDLRSLRRPPKGDFSVKMHF